MFFLFLISLILVALSTLVLLVGGNYAVLLWEEKVLDKIAKVSPNRTQSILDKSGATYSPSSKQYDDLGASGPERGNIGKFSRSLVRIYSAKHPAWFVALSDELQSLKENFIPTVQRWYKNLLNLILNNKNGSDNSHELIKEKMVRQEISEVAKNITTSKSLVLAESHEEKVSLDPEYKSSTATIDLASQKSKSENQTLEKFESRILEKLQKSGMSNYDLWLNLGELYLQHGENDKARQIFALVLKHDSGRPKEMARNYLISM